MLNAQEMFAEGVKHLQAGNFAAARDTYEAMAEREPDNVAILTNLAISYGEMNQMGTAQALFHRAISLDPNYHMAWANLGATVRGGLLLERKREALRTAIKLDPKDHLSMGNLAGAYVQCGNPQPGIAWARKALAIEPKNDSARSNLALLLMEIGAWREAWTYNDARWNTNGANRSTRRNYAAPEWDGALVDSLVIHGEQGLGDEIMFMGCVPMALERVKTRLVIECAPRLIPMVRRSFTDARVEVIGKQEDLRGEIAAVVAMADLPPRLGLDAPPRVTGYIKPDAARVDYWRARFAAMGPRPWIALGLWGGVKHTHEAVRNAPLSSWKPIVEAAGVAASIQYGASGPRMAEIVGVPHLALAADDLDEQAACIAASDALVSVPQTALHIGGAMGHRVLCPMSASPAWRYGLRGGMPWYGENVTLLRHERGSPWELMMKRVADAVRGLPC